MIHIIEFYFLVFLAYSILGWLIEVVVKSIEYKRFIDRGFLVGPYCPIYGVGGVLATLLLQKYSDDIVALFFFGIIIFSILEYYTSFFMEKLFHARWWDYSKNKYNINGRICLNTMIPFGLLGIVVVKFVNPIFFKMLESINDKYFDIIFIITFVLFIVDVTFSCNILNGVGKENKLVEKDNTEEVKKIVLDKIMSLGWGYRRLMRAFPTLEVIIKEVKDKMDDSIKEYNNKQRVIKEKRDKRISKIEQKYKNKINKLIDKYNKKIVDAGRQK